MDLTQFIILCVERDMVSNKFSLDIFYTAFKEAAMNCGIDASNNLDIDNKYVLISNNFYLAMTNLAKALYAHEENPFEAMFTKMLVDQKESKDKGLVSGRSPKMGSNTANILSEDSIKVYLTYLKPLQDLFKMHCHQNLNSDRIVSYRSYPLTRLVLGATPTRNRGAKYADESQRLPQNVPQEGADSSHDSRRYAMSAVKDNHHTHD